MTHFIIGASGVIGSALYDNLKSDGQDVVGSRMTQAGNPDLVPLDLRTADLSNFLSRVSGNDVVYLLAAYSNPSWIFEHKAAAAALNRDGTRRLVDGLRARMPHLIFMSSVEVFDGCNGRYVEGDQPNPLNYYGTLKFEIEQHLRASYPRATIVRTGWNVGVTPASRCVVRLTYETLLKPQARMATDNVFSIIDAKDTAEGLRRLAGADDVREIHFAADAKLHRDELATLICQSSRFGSRMDFIPCQFADIPYSEPRGRLNDLCNDLSKTRLHMQYHSAEGVIRRKVAILDSISHEPVATRL